MSILINPTARRSSAGTSVRETPNDKGPCTTDPDVMFPDPSDTAGIARAKAVCAICPLVAACRQAALDLEGPTRPPSDRFGIWGGLTPAERAEGWRIRPSEARPERITANAERLAPWLATVEPMIRAGQSMTAVAKVMGVSNVTVRARLLRHRRDLYDVAMGTVPA